MYLCARSALHARVSSAHVRAARRWALQRNGTRPRAASNLTIQHWGYNLPVAAGASVAVLATAVSAWIEARARAGPPRTCLAVGGLACALLQSLVSTQIPSASCSSRGFETARDESLLFVRWQTWRAAM